MSIKHYDTIIVGAGISGLACAKHLSEHQKNFLIISKDIGGRILTNKQRTANYGAFFVCSDYHHVLPYVTLKTQIRLRDFYFHDGQTSYGLFEPKLFWYFFQFAKAIRILYKFRNSFQRFRLNSESMSQKQAIEQDTFLFDLYNTNGHNFIKEQHLESGTDTYLSKALYSTTFSSIIEMNAFSLLQFLLPLITPIYRFRFEQTKLIGSFQDKLLIDTVEDIQYKNKVYKVKVGEKFFSSTNVIIATDTTGLKNLTGITKTNKGVNTHMYHLSGIPKQVIAQKKYHLFNPLGNIQGIANLGDKTFLVYYKGKQPQLKMFFKNPKILHSHFWDPAGTINGHILVESNRGNNMYVIGDYNVAGLEESFITGLYAANQIINR